MTIYIHKHVEGTSSNLEPRNTYLQLCENGRFRVVCLGKSEIQVTLSPYTFEDVVARTCVAKILSFKGVSPQQTVSQSTGIVFLGEVNDEQE